MTSRRNPPNRRNPPHNVGAPAARWEKFGRQCERLGTDRTAYLNRVMAWVNHEDGVTRPPRPAADDHADDSDLADDDGGDDYASEDYTPPADHHAADDADADGH